MKYVQYINSLIQKNVKNKSELVLFGQNIDAGSSLGGLTRGLSLQDDGLIINTQNSENSLVGVGFGLMLNNVSSVFFMKQMDFLLLGIDHLVNTYNIIRQSNPEASFTIFPVIVDSGYEGPQSALNNFDDFCSIAGVEGYSFSNNEDTKAIISKHLIKPGFRILSTGQRLLREDTLELEILQQESDCKYFQYKSGNDATVVCFNCSLEYGVELCNKLEDAGYEASLFSVNIHSEFNYNKIIENVFISNNLILIDDTKSVNKCSDKFIMAVDNCCKAVKKIIITRKNMTVQYHPCDDRLTVDYESIVNQLNETITGKNKIR